MLYAHGYPGGMAKEDTHTKARAIRIEDGLWLALGRLVGDRGRAALINQFIRWYLHQGELPERPELRGAASPPAST